MKKLSKLKSMLKQQILKLSTAHTYALSTTLPILTPTRRTKTHSVINFSSICLFNFYQHVSRTAISIDFDAFPCTLAYFRDHS